ncbi:MAG: hypothetical protein ACPLWD_05440 [Caldimicrobium thiodismutans]
MSITILATYYGMITFIPVSFPLNSEDIPRVLLVGRVGGLIGGILVALASDFFGRKITDTFVSFMSFLLSLLFLLSFNFDLTYLIYSFFAFSFASLAYVSATEIYPSYLGAYALGLISVIERLAGAISPVVLVSLASIIHTYGILGLSFLWFLGFVSFLNWSIRGLEAKGKAIEEITK